MVYTAQGFDFDWSGVIIGPDLVWRDDRWVTDRKASYGPVFKRSVCDASGSGDGQVRTRPGFRQTRA